jgi:hypothetical protein
MTAWKSALLSLALMGTVQAQPEVALVTDLEGRVERRRSTGPAWKSVHLDESLALKDGVRTWERSNAELRFVDGSVLMLTERTRMRISTALFDPQQAPPEIRVALAQGGLDVRTAAAPLVVQTDSGATHTVPPFDSAHVRVVGTAERASLVAGPARLFVSADLDGTLTPPDPQIEGGAEQTDATTAIVQAVDALVPLAPVVAVPSVLPEPIPEVEIDVRIEVRAGGEP